MSYWNSDQTEAIRVTHVAERGLLATVRVHVLGITTHYTREELRKVETG